ncbi:MAG TPA: hypothetical protein DHW02_23250 [Ktedonobacter sp.]|nr:hypothetical protein [Ktedonobacter sp.]
MQGEGQERVEDYLELQRYIEELQMGHVGSMPHLPEQMTPEQARVYRMAALFRSATTESVEPRPAFVEQLEARLLAQLQSASQQEGDNAADIASSSDEEGHHALRPMPLQSSDAPVPHRLGEYYPSSSEHSNVSRTRARFSRRNMLAGAAAVAASLGIGVGVGYTIEHTGNTANTGETDTRTGEVAKKFVWDPKTPLVGDVPTMWLEVTSLAQLGNGAVRFVTDALVGYVVRLNGHADSTDGIIAVSAACTHMGCLVNWHNADRRFHCPCHSGLFEASGEQANNPEYGYNLPPLPRLHTKVENGHVYVEVPTKSL